MAMDARGIHAGSWTGALASCLELGILLLDEELEEEVLETDPGEHRRRAVLWPWDACPGGSEEPARAAEGGSGPLDAGGVSDLCVPVLVPGHLS